MLHASRPALRSVRWFQRDFRSARIAACHVRRGQRQRLGRAFACAVAFFAMVFATLSTAGTLSDIPLSMRNSVPPNVMFALSVEFPTANTAAYQGTSDYSRNAEYLGYFDPAKCYDYDTTRRQFAPTGKASGHACTTKWSGNFLNWATMTGLDEFRSAMTGGYRSLDTETDTVIERTWQSGQGGTSNFPNKSFKEDGTATPFPVNTLLSLSNVGSSTGDSGIQMTVSLRSRTETVTCNSPTVENGAFSCGALALQSSSASAVCLAWSGSGSRNSPYQCTSFINVTGEAPSRSSLLATATSSVKGDTTVTCEQPAQNIQSSTCTMTTLGSSLQGSCTAWSGTGTAQDPYVCTKFSTFGPDFSFASNRATDSSQFSATFDDPQVSVAASCTVTRIGGNPTLTCPIGNDQTASCSVFAVQNRSYYCSGFSLPDGKKLVSANLKRYDTINSGGRSYYTQYTITWIPSVTETRYYYKSYNGSQDGNYVYASSYSLAFGADTGYYVRVKVCDPAIGLEPNCRKYGNSWKPIGTIQENGDGMRFGVMSYFNADDIDNAVLRAQIKSVAPLMPSDGKLVDNPNKEWADSNGILVSNPDGGSASGSYNGAVSNSGVINYVNKFGRQSKTYKTYDNVGKLYYEALRYLRGLTPTTGFYNGATTQNNDGFPVITSWTDPIQNSCQRNFIVVVGDTHTWCDKRLPGGAYNSTVRSTCNSYKDENGNLHSGDSGSLNNGDPLNVATLANSVGALEGITNLSTKANSYGGFNSGGFGMAGLAYWAARADFRVDKTGDQRVETVVIDVQEFKDCGFQSTFWLAAKYGLADAYDQNGNWKTRDNPAMAPLTLPAGACAMTRGPIPPAGYNDEGGVVQWPRNLLRGGDPASMVASVRGALSSISAKSGVDTALSQSANRLDNRQGAYLYRAAYRNTGWQGELEAFGIDTAGRIVPNAGWTASANLPAAADRKIFSFNDGQTGTTANGNAVRRGFAFTAANFPSAFSSAQRDLLNQSPGGTADGLGADRIDWLRGSRTNEAGTSSSSRGWRSRQSLIGDIINSNPQFVAAPSNVAGSRSFAVANANRTPAVYVGANDGMLHAFDASYQIDDNGLPRKTADSGKELFAYVPAAVYRNLNLLMEPGYTHKYFVDGTPAIADACLGNTPGNACADNWKTVLVGGLNAGGQGIYALDVTDPKAFDASKVLWEFTDQDDADLGYTFGTPLVRKLNNQKWAVIVGSGYNNTETDGRASSSGKAFLFILYVDGPGTGNGWRLNENYFKIELPSPSDAGKRAPLNPPNGVSSLIDLDKAGDGTTDIVYVGDRRGNVWKIDLSSTAAPTATAPTWGSDIRTNGVATPLFIATAPITGTGTSAQTPAATQSASATPAAQQITRGMEVVRHPGGGFMVLFGTGAWVDSEDYGDTTAQSFYGIWDRDDGSVVSRANLQRQKIITTVAASGASCTAGTAGCMAIVSRCTPSYVGTQGNDALCPNDIATGSTTTSTSGGISVNPSANSSANSSTGTAAGTRANASAGTTTGQLGWVFDLASSGERARSTIPLVNGRVVTFTTLSPSPGNCDIGATGAEYNLDWLTGGAPRQSVYVLPGNTTGYLTVTLPSNVNATVAPAGKWLAAGPSDNFVRLRAFDDEGAATSVGAGSASAACVGAACNDIGRPYIPGWGFVSDLRSPTDRASRPIDFAFDASIQSDGRYKDGQFGRLNWRQLDKE